MKKGLTFHEAARLSRVVLAGLFVVSSSAPALVSAQDKRTFTQFIDLRPGKEDALLDVFKPLSEQFTDEYKALGTAFTAGEILYQQKRYPDAIRNFETVIAKSKRYPYLTDVSKSRLAQSLLMGGDAEEALRVGREVANSNSKAVAAEAWFTIARAHLSKGKIDRAEEAYKNMLTVNPVYKGLMKVDLLAGLISLEKGAFLEAASHFQRHSDHIPSLYYSIAGFCQMKDIAKAINAYQSLLGKAKKGIWVDRARILIGEAIYQTKDYDLAMTFFGPVSRRDAPANLRVLALYRLACIDFQKKNYTRCELTLQNLLKEYPVHPLRTDWLYLVATIPVYQRDWNRTIKEEGRFAASGKSVAPAPRAIPPEQLAPEAQFRVIWANMALGHYNDVTKLTDRFYKRYPKNTLTGYSLLLQGVAYDQLGNKERAIDSYQTLVDLFPQSPAAGKAVYLMTLSLTKARESSRVVSALNHMNESLQRSDETRSDEWRKNTLFWIAEGYYSIQDFKNAAETYKRFVEVAPDHSLAPYALQGLSASLAALGDNDKAKIYQQQARDRAAELGINEIAADAKLQLGKLLYNQRDYEGAVAQFDAYVKESTNTVRVAEALFNGGLALEKQQYFTDAIARWKQVIDGYRFSPYRPQAYLKTGQIQAGLGRYDQSIAAYQSLAANYPNTPEAQDAQFQIIMSYYNKGDLRGAYQQFSAFKNSFPADERLRGVCENLLSAYQSQSNKSGLQSAELSDLLRSCQGSGTASQILWERGANLFNKKDYASAQKYFQRIMLSYPNEEFASQAYYYNAECYFNLNSWDQAASAYKSFYINYPNDKMVPQAMFKVGVSLFNKKDFAKAALGFDEFLKRYPQHEMSKDAALNVALCHKKAFRLDEAIRAYQNYLLLFPRDEKSVFVRLQIGQLYASKGNFSAAIKEYETIPMGTGERLEAQYRIGEAYTNMHQDGEAQAAYMKLLSMGPCENDFRITGLIELGRMIEAKGSTQNLAAIYSSIASCSKDPQAKAGAQQKLKELKGGQ